MSEQRIRELCLKILNDGRQRFAMSLGIVSRIEVDNYSVFAVLSDTGVPQAGDVYALDAVYCREVFEKRSTVAITEINGHQGMCLHPLYTFIPCEAYISSPILVYGETWGTLNFTSLEMRDSAFSAEDIAFNEHQAARIAVAISESGDL